MTRQDIRRKCIGTQTTADIIWAWIVVVIQMIVCAAVIALWLYSTGCDTHISLRDPVSPDLDADTIEMQLDINNQAHISGKDGGMIYAESNSIDASTSISGNLNLM